MTYFVDLPRITVPDLAAVLSAGIPSRRTTLVVLSAGAPVAVVVSAPRAQGMAPGHVFPGGPLFIEQDQAADFLTDLLFTTARVGRPVIVRGCDAGLHRAALIPPRWLAESPGCTVPMITSTNTEGLDHE